MARRKKGTGSARAKSIKPKRAKALGPKVVAEAYDHPYAQAVQRPEVGLQTQFRKKLPPAVYRYDSSLSPALDWDGQNPTREMGEAALSRMREALAEMQLRLEALGDSSPAEKDSLKQAALTLREDIERLIGLGRPFLNWAGKAEGRSFEVPTLPLFVHDKLSTEAIISSLKVHRRDEQAGVLTLNLFGDDQRSLKDKLVGAYQHPSRWVNRMILGDSLVVMNSLLQYEKLGGQVQMIYMDPPYGVKFGSNFQPFVRNREVKHNDDAYFTREPEMVQAYRDTWEIGLHSYLTYLRDRLLLARDMLAQSGSLFVQISDENLHHVREVLDEIFGIENRLGLILFRKTGGLTSRRLASVGDYLLWYAKDSTQAIYNQLYLEKRPGETGATQFRFTLRDDGSLEEVREEDLLRVSPALLVAHDNLTSQGNPVYEYVYQGRTFRGGYKTPRAGMDKLGASGRLVAVGNTLRYVRRLSDFPVFELNELWEDVGISGFVGTKLYVVQTSAKVIERCVLMTTNPGDLVLDPTCGSGTSAFVAEQWGRRWITIDTSRVPLALARQRLLTANFPWYELADETRGPTGGFVYKRKQSGRGEELGGIVPHITLKSIVNNEPPEEEVLVDRPEENDKIVRVSGAFWVEATIPTPVDLDEDGIEDSTQAIAQGYADFACRMLEVLRKSPLIRVPGNTAIRLSQVRPPAKSLYINAEALVEATAPGQTPTLTEAIDEAEAKRGERLDFTKKPVAFVFGPESGAVSEKLIYSAGKEANAKHYAHLYVIGFAIQPDARALIDLAEELLGIPATYVQATPDLMMGDLLKTTQTSQVFSVCGLPDIEIRPNKANHWVVELHGLDTFDPITNEVKKLEGKHVPAWFLDAAWDGHAFHVSQAFFPRTGAWDSLKKALRAEYAESVWDHLAGTVSAPFEGKKGDQIGVKVIDDRGNELLVVKTLGEN